MGCKLLLKGGNPAGRLVWGVRLCRRRGRLCRVIVRLAFLVIVIIRNYRRGG